MKQKQVTARMDERFVEQFDFETKLKGYEFRTEAIEDAMREFILPAAPVDVPRCTHKRMNFLQRLKFLFTGK